MKCILIATAAVMAAVATAPAAQADEYSFIYAIENSGSSVYYGMESDFIDAGYRVCRQLGMGYSKLEAATYLLKISPDLDGFAAGEFVAHADIHLC